MAKVRLVDTHDSMLDRNHDGWRNMQSQVGSKGEHSMDIGSKVSDKEIDAIANMMDSVSNEPQQSMSNFNQQDMPQLSDPTPGPVMSPQDMTPEKEMERMIMDYVKDNGSMPVDNNRSDLNKPNKKSGTLFG